MPALSSTKSFKTWPYKGKKIHFIGVGGIGMSGLAKICQFNHSIVSGSDKTASIVTDDLAEHQVMVYIGHHADQLPDCDLVVVSTAINEDNPELIEARKKKIKIESRGVFLGKLLESFKVISIAGSHGKTTTSSLCSVLLNETGVVSNFLVGGILKNYQTQVGTFNSPNFVVEVDESDGSFLKVKSDIAIITNIDNDHLNYHGTLEKLVDAFRNFCRLVHPDGVIIYNLDDINLAKVVSSFSGKKVSISSQNKKSDYYISNVEFMENSTSFKLNQEFFEVPMLGEHNVYNSAGAIILAKLYEQKYSAIAQALKNFKGIGRRQDLVLAKAELLIFDDYAHHPTEVKKTIDSFYKKYHERLLVVFEPHRYTRTYECWKEFVQAFDNAPELFLLPIYTAGEMPIKDVTSEILTKEINQKRKIPAHYIQDLKAITKYFKSDTVVLALGAGSISRDIRNLARELGP